MGEAVVDLGSTGWREAAACVVVWRLGTISVGGGAGHC